MDSRKENSKMADKEKDLNLEDEDIEDTTGTTDDGTDGKDGDQSGDSTGQGEKKKPERTFTQSQIKRMMTKEKNQGRSAALKELGIDPSDSKMVNMVKALIASQKSDEQKAAEQTAAEASKIAEAEAKALRAEAKAEAMVMGTKAEFVDDVVVLAMAKMDEDSDLKTIIGELKIKYPNFFTDGSSTDVDDKKDDKSKDGKDGKGKATGQKGTGASIKNLDKDKKDGEQKSLGSRLAAQRRSATKKGSNFIKR